MLLATLVLILVLVLLLVIFRSPIIALMPIIAIAIVAEVALGLIADVNSALNLNADSQTTVILIVVLFGIGTDYILFLMCRYRERLRAGDAPRQAMAAAVERVGEVIASAASVVIVAFLALLPSSPSIFRSLGPTLAIAVAVTLVAALTLIAATATPIVHAILVVHITAGASPSLRRPLNPRPKRGAPAPSAVGTHPTAPPQRPLRWMSMLVEVWWKKKMPRWMTSCWSEASVELRAHTLIVGRRTTFGPRIGLDRPPPHGYPARLRNRHACRVMIYGSVRPGCQARTAAARTGRCCTAGSSAAP